MKIYQLLHRKKKKSSLLFLIHDVYGGVILCAPGIYSSRRTQPFNMESSRNDVELHWRWRVTVYYVSQTSYRCSERLQLRIYRFMGTCVLGRSALVSRPPGMSTSIIRVVAGAGCFRALKNGPDPFFSRMSYFRLKAVKSGCVHPLSYLSFLFLLVPWAARIMEASDKLHPLSSVTCFQCRSSQIFAAPLQDVILSTCEKVKLAITFRCPKHQRFQRVFFDICFMFFTRATLIVFGYFVFLRVLSVGCSGLVVSTGLQVNYRLERLISEMKYVDWDVKLCSLSHTNITWCNFSVKF